MWRKLFPPRWRHRNPAIRAEAVSLLDADDPNLHQVALRDADAGIRRLAVRRLQRLDLLLELASEDRDESVRQSARRKAWQLLAGEEGDISEEEAATTLNKRQDPEMAEYLVQHAGSRQVRRLALTMLDKPALLAGIALNDSDKDIRLEALKAIDRLPTLDRIAKEARGRDKRVARMAREMADGLREQQERPAKQQKLVEQMETFAGLQQPDQTAVLRLESEWEALQTDADAVLVERFRKAHEEVRQAIEQARSAREALERQREVCDQAKKLLDDLEQNAGTPSYDLEGVEKIASLFRNSWQQLKADYGELNAALERELAEILDRLQQRAGEIGRHRREHAQQLAIISEIEQLARSDQPPAANRLKNIEQHWRDLPGKPEADLERSFRQFLQQARSRLEQSAERAGELETGFDRHLELLEKALDDGKLASANSAMGMARKCHDELQQIAPHKLRKTQSHWNRLLGRLAELRDWQRFGSNNVREDLITAMQLLTSTDLSVNERVKQVRRLRNQWRDLDRKGAAPTEQLLERFNTAADEAFAPVVAHRETQQEARQQAVAERSAFCDSIEQELATIEWSDPDWPSIDARLRELHDQWRKLGGVDKQSWADLSKRFRDCIEDVEEKLAGMRESEKQRRERLIKQVQRLASEPDLQVAISETLAAQQKWKPLVAASRSVEQRLWKAFRAACDTVFERRNAQNAEVNRELEENADRKQALVDAMLKLVALPAGERQSAADERDRLVTEWGEIGQVPKKRLRELSGAWSKALEAFDKAEEAARTEVANAYIDKLVEQSAQLDQLEHSASNGDSVSPGEGFLTLFADRLEAIGKGNMALRDAQETNAGRRNRLCLEMEVLLELDTPEAHADERRQWQLEHLSDAMTGGLDISPRERAITLLEEACRTGAVPQEMQQALEERLEKIVSALKQ